MQPHGVLAQPYHMCPQVVPYPERVETCPNHPVSLSSTLISSFPVHLRYSSGVFQVFLLQPYMPCITKPTRCISLNFVPITPSTCFEQASCSSSGGSFTVHAVYGMYHAENVLTLFKLYIVLKSKNQIVYKIIYKMLILKELLLKGIQKAQQFRIVY